VIVRYKHGVDERLCPQQWSDSSHPLVRQQPEPAHSFTLEPGDVMLTGTPWGCREFRNPPRSLAACDAVEVEVNGIRTLRHPCGGGQGL
jgi:hypothetical protein